MSSSDTSKWEYWTGYMWGETRKSAIIGREASKVEASRWKIL